jgi:hypothetical protein
MTGAVPAAAPAATAAAGNATLLSAQPDPDTTPVTPPAEPPADPPAEPPAEGDTPPAEGEEPKGGEGEAEPEDYGTFDLPEGTTVDQAALDTALPEFKEAGLTKAQAQTAIGLYIKLQAKQAEAQAAQVQQWAKDVVADKEIGGAKWAENRAVIARARDAFASPELVQLMEQTGLGSHPEVIKLFVRVGKAISDDGHVIGGNPGPDPRSAESFYARMAR